MSDALTKLRDERYAERQEFEQWYVENAFDIVRDPVGSGNCALQWAAWHAARDRVLDDLTALRTANVELRKELEAARAQIEHLQRGLNASLGWSNPIIKQGV